MIEGEQPYPPFETMSTWGKISYIGSLLLAAVFLLGCLGLSVMAS